MRLFGTDGIRGRVNTHPMTPETVMRVGQAAAKLLKKEHGRNTILIGKDTRLSGYMIESALTAGICSMGMNVTLIGPVPTPGVAYLTRALRLDAGMVISASHNPFEDNGIKIFSSDGFKLPDEMESKIEEIALDGAGMDKRPHGMGIGKAKRLEDATGRYIEYVKSTIPRGMTLEGLRVVVDCANGAAYKVTPNVLRELGADVIVINDEPNGVNINDGCGSLHVDLLAGHVTKNKADIGIAHDGDADRSLFCDERGNVIDGDQVMAIWAVEMKEDGRLNGDAVVATVMSNLGVEHYLQSHGIKLIRTKVGDRFVTEHMIKHGYNLGGEQSGHIVFFDYNTTGDGPITALHVMYLMKKKRRKLSTLVSGIARYPQVLINVPVAKKSGLSANEYIQDEIRSAEEELGGRGRVLVRPSGTEQKIRVMVEADEEKLTKRIAGRLAKAVKEQMG